MPARVFLSLLAAVLLTALGIVPPAAAVTYAHIVDLNTVPFSQGNGSLFTGQVCWIGILGSGNCFPGYGNNVSQAIFKGFSIPPASNWHLSYRYRSDCQPASDITYVIADRSGQCPVMQSSGDYAFQSSPGQRDTLASYEGPVEGTDFVDLSGYANQTICIVVNSVSDGSGSDADCGWNSLDGLFEIDNIEVGADLTTFDAGANGWTFGPIGPQVGPPTRTPATSGVANLFVLLGVAFLTLCLRSRALSVGTGSGSE